jgi:hypothetical protein
MEVPTLRKNTSVRQRSRPRRWIIHPNSATVSVLHACWNRGHVKSGCMVLSWLELKKVTGCAKIDTHRPSTMLRSVHACTPRASRSDSVWSGRTPCSSDVSPSTSCLSLCLPFNDIFAALSLASTAFFGCMWKSKPSDKQKMDKLHLHFDSACVWLQRRTIQYGNRLSFLSCVAS